MKPLLHRLGAGSRTWRRARPGARATHAQHAALALLFVLAAGSALMLYDLDSELLGASQASAQVPDFFAENFATTVLDERGRPRRRLEAQYMAHYLGTEAQEFTRPYLVMYREAATPWHVRSERGRLSAKGDLMLMMGDVLIWRNRPDGERDFEIKTRDLRVLPDEEYGETHQPVVITTRRTRSRGVGMRAFLDERRLELLSQVQTIYDRNAYLP